MNRTEQIFIVGSSRSGTTMMGRILNNHPHIFTFNELHFFGTLWTNSSLKELNSNDAILLLSRLLCIQERGFFNQNKIMDFNEKAMHLLAQNKTRDPLEIYALFLNNISSASLCSIPCEQTPNNIYYIKEILDFFPNAKIINMIRDQRDVLLSQKNKWKRRFLGASEIPFSEAIRSYINYHPITMARLWNSSVLYGYNLRNHKRVKDIKFEQLLSDPEDVIKEICSFLKIDFQQQMLQIPVVGSSTEQDTSNDLLIDKTKIEKWKKGGLSNAEIYLSQLFSNNMMSQFSYDLKGFKFPPFLSLFYLFSFPIKIGIAFLLNIKRMGSVSEVVKKKIL